MNSENINEKNQEKTDEKKSEEVKVIRLDYNEPKVYPEETVIYLTKEVQYRRFALKLCEHLSKYISYYVNRYMYEHGLNIDYVISIRFNELGYPALVVEILSVSPMGAGTFVLDKQYEKKQGE